MLPRSDWSRKMTGVRRPIPRRRSRTELLFEFSWITSLNVECTQPFQFDQCCLSIELSVQIVQTNAPKNPLCVENLNDAALAGLVRSFGGGESGLRFNERAALK